ncbi:MAG: ankyrin repeat domain-containing protein, partial [Candidatus Babeliales bacterium]
VTEISRKIANNVCVNGKKYLFFVSQSSSAASIGRCFLLSSIYYMIPYFNSILQIAIPFLFIEKFISDRDNYFINAIADNDVKELISAIESGADVNGRWQCHFGFFFYDTTPLIQAIEEDSRPEIIKTLILYNADVNQATSERLTPSIAAVKSKRLDIVELLLNSKADTTIADDNNKIGLYYALKTEEDISLIMLHSFSENRKKEWGKENERNQQIIKLLQNSHQQKTAQFLKEVLPKVQKFNDDLNGISGIIAAYAWPIVNR